MAERTAAELSSALEMDAAQIGSLSLKFGLAGGSVTKALTDAVTAGPDATFDTVVALTPMGKVDSLLQAIDTNSGGAFRANLHTLLSQDDVREKLLTGSPDPAAQTQFLTSLSQIVTGIDPNPAQPRPELFKQLDQLADNMPQLEALANSELGAKAIAYGFADLSADTSALSPEALSQAVMGGFAKAALEVGDANATYQALTNISGLRTGNADIDAGIAETGSFLTTLDANGTNAGFRQSLHDFVTKQGVDGLNLDELVSSSGLSAEAAQTYKTTLTNLAGTEYGREAFTRALTTLSGDTDGLTSDDFQSAIQTGLTAEFDERFDGLSGDELLEAMKGTEGLIGNADVQAKFFEQLEAEPETMEAFLGAVQSNPNLLVSLSYEAALDPTQTGTFAGIISSPLPEDLFTQTLEEKGLTLGADQLNSLTTAAKAGVIRDVLSNPDYDLAEARDYIANFTDPDTGSVDFSSLSTAVNQEGADVPEAIKAVFTSIANTATTEVMKDPANWFALLDGLGGQWDEIFDKLYDKVAELNLPPEIKQALQGLVTVLQEGLPHMLEGLKMVGWDLPVSLVGEIDRAAKPARDDRREAREAFKAAAAEETAAEETADKTKAPTPEASTPTQGQPGAQQQQVPGAGAASPN